MPGPASPSRPEQPPRQYPGLHRAVGKAAQEGAGDQPQLQPLPPLCQSHGPATHHPGTEGLSAAARGGGDRGATPRHRCSLKIAALQRAVTEPARSVKMNSKGIACLRKPQPPEQSRRYLAFSKTGLTEAGIIGCV